MSLQIGSIDLSGETTLTGTTRRDADFTDAVLACRNHPQCRQP
jgi:hypothetical protein